MPAPIDRTALTALVDDDGTGTTGSVLNKATLADVFHDEIDVALTNVKASTDVGTQNDYALGATGAAVFRWNGASAVTFNGWANGAAGRSVLFQNITAAQNATFANEAGASTAANRFVPVTGADLVVPAGGLALIWYDATTARWRVTTVGNVTPAIKFPATQVSSSDANTLDDYEEGTWTAVLTFATPGNLSVAYTTQAGSYTKIGRKVTLTFTVITSAFTHTTASGNVQITGLPFTAGATYLYFGALQWSGVTKASYTNLVARIESSGTSIQVVASGSGQAAAFVTAADMPTGGSVQLVGTITYFT